MSKTTESTLAGLAAAKRERHISDRAIAEALGVARTTVNAKFRGQNPLTLDELESLCDALGVPVEVVMQGRSAVLRWLADNPDATIHLTCKVLLTHDVLDLDRLPAERELVSV